MLKKFFKYLALLIILILIVQVVLIFPIIYPQKYFDYKVEYKNFIVYSDIEINEDIKYILDETEKRLNNVEINIPEKRYKLFICNSIELYGKFSAIVKKNKHSQGMTVPLLNNTFISMSYIKQINDKYGSEYRFTIMEGNPAHIITHELIHILVYEKLGFFSSRNLPFWKYEGYAEFAASASLMNNDIEFSSDKRVEKLKGGYFDHLGPTRKKYILTGLLVNYLIHHKGLEFAQLMSLNTKKPDMSLIN